MTEHAHHTVHPHKQPQENGLAIAAFILGIVSLTGFGALTGIPAIITGFMSLKNPVNKGMGIAGLVMGSISTLITVLAVLFFVLIFALAALSDPTPTYDMPTHDGPRSSQTRSI